MAAQFKEGDDTDNIDLKSLFEREAKKNTEIKRLFELLDSKFTETFSQGSGKEWGTEGISALFQERSIDGGNFFKALGEAQKSTYRALTGLDVNLDHPRERDLKSFFKDHFERQVRQLLKAENVDIQALEKLISEFFPKAEEMVNEMRAFFKAHRADIVAFIDSMMQLDITFYVKDLEKDVKKLLEDNHFHELSEWPSAREQLIALQKKFQGFIEILETGKAEVFKVDLKEMTDSKRVQEYRDQMIAVSQKIKEVEEQTELSKKELEEIRAGLRKAKVAAQLKEATQILETLQPSWQEANSIRLEATAIWEGDLKEMKEMSDSAAFWEEREYIRTTLSGSWGSLSYLLDLSKKEIFASPPTDMSRAQIERKNIEEALSSSDSDLLIFFKTEGALRELKKYQENVVESLNRSREVLAKTQALRQAVQVVGPKFSERVEILKPLKSILRSIHDSLSYGNQFLEQFEEDMQEAQSSTGDFKLMEEVQEIQAAIADIRKRVNRSSGYWEQLVKELVFEGTTANEGGSLARQTRIHIARALQEAGGDVDKARQLADESLEALRGQVSKQLAACEELLKYAKEYSREIDALKPRVKVVNEQLRVAREVSERELGALFFVSSESEQVLEQIRFSLSQLDELLVPPEIRDEDDREVIAEIKAAFEPYQCAVESIRAKFTRGLGYHQELAKRLAGNDEGNSFSQRVEHSVVQAFKSTGGDIEKTQQLVNQNMQALVLEMAQQKGEHEELLKNLRQYLQEITDLSRSVYHSQLQADQQLREMRKRKADEIRNTKKLIESTALAKADIGPDAILGTIFGISKSTTETLDRVEGILQKFKGHLSFSFESRSQYSSLNPRTVLAIARKNLAPYEEAIRSIQRKCERALKYNEELTRTLFSSEWDYGDSLLGRTREAITSAFREAGGDLTKTRQLIDRALETLTAGARQEEGNYRELLGAVQGYLKELEELEPKITEALEQTEKEINEIERQQGEAQKAAHAQAREVATKLSSISIRSDLTIERIESQLSELERYSKIILASAENDAHAVELQAKLASHQAKIKDIREQFTRNSGSHRELRSTIVDLTYDKSLRSQTDTIIENAFKNSEDDVTKAQQLMNNAIEALAVKVRQEENNYQELLKALDSQLDAVLDIRVTLNRQYASLENLITSILRSIHDSLSYGNQFLEQFEEDMQKAQSFTGDFKLMGEVQEIQAAVADIRTRNQNSRYWEQLVTGLFRERIAVNKDSNIAQQARTRIEHTCQEVKGDVERAQQLANEVLGTRGQVSEQLVICELLTHAREYSGKVDALKPRVKVVNEQLRALREKQNEIVYEIYNRELGGLFSISFGSDKMVNSIEESLSKLENFLSHLSFRVEDDKKVVAEIKAAFEPYQHAVESIRAKFTRGSGYHQDLAKRLTGGESSLYQRIRSSVEKAFKSTGGDVERTQQLVNQEVQALISEITEQGREHQELLNNLHQYFKDITDLTLRFENSRQQAHQRLHEMRARQKLMESTALAKADIGSDAILGTIFGISKSTTETLDRVEGMLQDFTRRLSFEDQFRNRFSNLKTIPAIVRKNLAPYEEAILGIRTKFERALKYNEELMRTLFSSIGGNSDSSLLGRTREIIRSAFREAEGDLPKAQRLMEEALETLTAGARQQEGNYRELLGSLQGYLKELEALEPNIKATCDQAEKEMNEIERQQGEVIGAALTRTSNIIKKLSSISMLSDEAVGDIESELSRLERYSKIIIASAGNDAEALELQTKLASHEAEIKGIRERFTRSSGYHQELRGTILTGGKNLREHTEIIIRNAFNNSEENVIKAQQLRDNAIAALGIKVSQEEGNYQELLAALQDQLTAVRSIRTTLETQYASLDLKTQAEKLVAQARETENKARVEALKYLSPSPGFVPKQRGNDKENTDSRKLVERAKSVIANLSGHDLSSPSRDVDIDFGISDELDVVEIDVIDHTLLSPPLTMLRMANRHTLVEAFPAVNLGETLSKSGPRPPE